MRFLIPLLLLSIVFSCKSDPGLQIMIPPGGASHAMVTGTLKNEQGKTLLFENMESSVSEYTEMHENIGDEGEMMMRKVRNLQLKPGSTLRLDHGGQHIMLINLTRELKAGMTAEIIVPDLNKAQHTFQAKVIQQDH